MIAQSQTLRSKGKEYIFETCESGGGRNVNATVVGNVTDK